MNTIRNTLQNFFSNVSANKGEINRSKINLLQSIIYSELNRKFVYIIFFISIDIIFIYKKLEQNILRKIMDCVHIIFFVPIDITYI